MDQSTLVLDTVIMKDNDAGRSTKNIFSVFSVLYILGSTLSYDSHVLSVTDSTLSLFFGGFIFLSVNCTAYIEGTSFTNSEAYNGGAIYVSSDSQLTVTGSTFTDCYASSNGGAIFA
jgi:predicted outer membrane repeat protein